jgi:cytochrome c-type biogenesis protein CcmH/NrfF
MRVTPWRVGLLSIGICSALLQSGLAAQIPEGMEGSFAPHPEAEEAISRLYSPFCPGFMLKVCTASQSAALRDSIQAFAYQGWTADELVEWMISNYGEEYRAVPDTGGLGIFAWILPPLGIVLGAGMVVVALRRFRPGAEAPGSGHVGADQVERPITPEEQARLRSAIREIELSEDPSF